MKSDGIRVLAQNSKAERVGWAAYLGKISRYIKSPMEAISEKQEIILRSFIKSLPNEYIETVNGFMKLFDELIKKTVPQLFVEIRGRESLLAEGYCKIEVYSDFDIVLASDNGRIAVSGEGLHLRHLSSQRIAIDGRVDRVEFI